MLCRQTQNKLSIISTNSGDLGFDSEEMHSPEDIFTKVPLFELLDVCPLHGIALCLSHWLTTALITWERENSKQKALTDLVFTYNLRGVADSMCWEKRTLSNQQEHVGPVDIDF